jgi:hypothetical protein
LSDRPAQGEFTSGWTWAEVYRKAIDIFFEARSAVKAHQRFNDFFGFNPLPTQAREAPASKSFVVSAEDFTSDQSIAPKARIDRPGFQGHSSLTVWLRNPVLRGHTRYDTLVSKGLDSAGRKAYSGRKPLKDMLVARDTHPDQALMSDSEAEAIEAILAGNQKIGAWGTQSNRYPLSGLIRCADCGGRCKSKSTRVLANGDFHRY